VGQSTADFPGSQWLLIVTEQRQGMTRFSRPLEEYQGVSATDSTGFIITQSQRAMRNAASRNRPHAMKHGASKG
jgi:hypothetical protein